MGIVSMNCPNCGAQVEMNDGLEFGYCNMCGSKVMVDKMIVEHKGSVKIDNTEIVEKFLANARRAKQKEDWEETEKYYNLVEQNDPTNIEAIFYSSYGKAKSSLVESDLYKRQAAFKVLTNCVSIVDDNFDVAKEETERETIEQISKDILLMACSNYVYNMRKNGYGVVTWTDKLSTVTLFNVLGIEFCTTLENIAKKIPDEQKQKRAHYYEIALKHADFILKNGSLLSPKEMQDRIMRYHRKIQEVDPSHIVPEAPPAPGARAKSGGCYVATCVYGSYDCPQVWTLRRYRDDTLASTWYGRAFIRTYYAVSPTLVKWFGKTAWFKKMWQGKLDRMVRRLNASGVADTPYNDKRW